MSQEARILYCHCAYAKVVPDDVKNDVLRRLAESGVAFDAVADLCELSAKKDPSLSQLLSGVDEGNELRIAACYPRAVKWLLSAAGIDWPAAGLDVVNMRTEQPEPVVQILLNGRPPGQPAPPEDEEPGDGPSKEEAA